MYVVDVQNRALASPLLNIFFLFRKALYVFLHSSLVKISGGMDEFCTGLKDMGSLSKAVRLRCETHRKEKPIHWPEELDDFSPEGGCDQLCLQALPGCLHECPYPCHHTDPNHASPKYACAYDCEKQCERGKFSV
jgi:hypothetical protein